MDGKDIIEITDILKTCCIAISECIREGDSDGFGKFINIINRAGDEVKKLDLISNQILKHHLSDCEHIRSIGSEEEETLVETKFNDAPYMICFDPLDGSSNINVNITIGTIFALYKYNEKGVISDGNDIIIAGYCLYGGSTQFIIADETHVEMHHLIKSEFMLLNPNLVIPQTGNIYSINESNKHKWIDKTFNSLIESFIAEGKTTRWVGSLVADAHRTLIKGGFFAYPSNYSHHNGKLRLLYEVYPFAFIFKAAGGQSYGKYTQEGLKYKGDILDLPFPENIHQKVSTILSGPIEMDSFKSWKKRKQARKKLRQKQARKKLRQIQTMRK